MDEAGVFVVDVVDTAADGIPVERGVVVVDVFCYFLKWCPTPLIPLPQAGGGHNNGGV
jgi:hypothetical protein